MRLAWPSNAMNWKHALSEVLLIVVGVLIALGASDWQTRRVERGNELTLLREILSGLSSDLEVLEARRDRFQQIQSRLEVLLPYLQSNAPYADSLDAYFGSMYGNSSFEPNMAAYESLKSQGIGLVSNPAIRSQIALVYEQAYASIEASLETESNVVLEVLRPYFLLHFRDLRFNQTATPLSYDSLRGSVEFANLVSYRLQVVRQNHLPRFESGIAEVQRLISVLEQELDT